MTDRQPSVETNTDQRLPYYHFRASRSLPNLSMDVPIPHNAQYQVRRIRNIELVYSDLRSLISGGTKIPGTTMNAFGAALQQNDEVADYAILSSYLDPVVSRPSSETRAFGTLRGHIEAAVSSLQHSLSHWQRGSQRNKHTGVGTVQC